MRWRAQFPGYCRRCGRRFRKGAWIDWAPGASDGAVHWRCRYPVARPVGRNTARKAVR